ncbi:polycystic kidney disease protein 1-like 2 [Branchiostoma floridae]|uniref:Polycystic kidney disease protein 1-like 2 n=1 Tax=Branchiostoma floridae TaxID=7739 RepID=A0A9J7MDB5_BRAFL|nr:polycystic kidney disease protein 1-like 2 [Branchiostoma floridae]
MLRSVGHVFHEALGQADDDSITNDDFLLSPEEREARRRRMKEERDQMKRTVVARGRKILNDMAELLRRELRPGGPAIRIDTDSLSLQVQKIRGKDLADHRLNGTGVNTAFPSAETLFQGFVPRYIDAKVISFHDNPFTWGNNSNIINSGVHDISLIPSTVSPGEIRDTEEDILITIATNGADSSSGLVYEVDSTGNGSVVHHVFNISDVDDAFVVQVTAMNRSSRISVFGRGEGLAHSKNCEVCLTWQDWKPTASHHGAPESRSVMFFVSGNNHTGRYYVGVDVAGMDDVYQDAVDDGVLLVDPADQSSLSLNGTQFYSLKVLRLSCRYWAEDTESWLPKGCKVHPTSTVTETVCACNHMTAFGAGFVTAPNTIDLTTVFDKFADIGNNAGVFATVLTTLALYFVGIIFLRRVDKAGMKKLIVHSLPDNRSTDTYYYKMTVYTSHGRGSGTKSNVAFSLFGDSGSTGVRVFKQDPETFQAGGVDIFLMAVEESLGDLHRLQIWHDNQGGDDRAWKLDKVIVRDLQSEDTNSFLCNHWLSLDRGDSRINRILPASTEHDLSSFHLFTTKATGDFRNEHIWLSTLFCPSGSHFSKVQRLSCGLCIIYTTMIANAMWYKTENNVEQTTVVNLGIVSFTLHELYVSTMTSLCVLPVNVLLIQLFNRCKEKKQPAKNSVYAAEKEDARSLMLNTRSSSQILPHGFVYVAWSVLVLVCCVSAFFTILYSLEWGPEKANAWLKTFLISFVQDVFVVQPVKILALSALVSFVCKKAAVVSTRDDFVRQHVDVEDSRSSEGGLFAWISHRATMRVAKQQLHMALSKHHQSDAESQKERKKKEETRKQTDNVIQEVVGFFLIVMLLLVVANGGTNVYSHHAYNTLGGIFQTGFDQIQTADDYWSWARDVLVPGLFQEQHYNGDKLGWRRRRFISDAVSYRIGAARFKQIRVKSRSCGFHQRYTSLFLNQECNSGNSFSDGETRDFLPGWRLLSSSNSSEDFHEQSPWTYQIPDSGGELPVMADIATYGSGGYVAGVGRNKDAALAVIADLKEADWIDRYTRAVVVEFTVYNANINFFSTMSYTVEFLNMGGVVSSLSIRTYRLHRFVGPAGYIILALHILYVVCFLYTLYREAKLMKEQGKRYCQQPWNLLEIVNILVSFSAFAVFAVDYITSRNTLDKLLHHHESSKYISFDLAFFWNQVFVWTVATVAFINILKFLRVLRFNPLMSVLMTSLRRMLPEVAGFAVYFSFLFLSFVQLGHLVFGLKIQEYSTISASGKSLFLCALGSFNFDKILSASRIIGPMFLYSYLCIVFIIIINILVAIINDALVVMRGFTPPPEHREILQELWRRLANFLGLANTASQENDMLASERLDDRLTRLNLLTRAMKERQVAENVMRSYYQAFELPRK